MGLCAVCLSCVRIVLCCAMLMLLWCCADVVVVVLLMFGRCDCARAGAGAVLVQTLPDRAEPVWDDDVYFKIADRSFNTLEEGLGVVCGVVLVVCCCGVDYECLCCVCVNLFHIHLTSHTHCPRRLTNLCKWGCPCLGVGAFNCASFACCEVFNLTRAPSEYKDFGVWCVLGVSCVVFVRVL